MPQQHILKSRRFWLGVLAIIALVVLGLRGADVAWPLASIAVGTAASNAYQKRGVGSSADAPDDSGDAE